MENYVAVVGAANMDIWGCSAAALIGRDSNPGVIRLAPGGVGRNIAHNLCRMGVRTEMLTALGGDLWAETLEQSCRSIGIGLDFAVRLPDARSSTYLYVTGPDGELSVGICDADIIESVTPAAIEARLELLNRAALVVFDGNLTEEAIGCLTEKCTVPLFADPVSVTKARRLKPFLHRIHSIKPNAQEAAELTGVSDPAGAAEELVYLGVKRAFVSDGANGIYAAHGLDSYRIPCRPAKLKNCTGCGDAVTAALARSFLDGRDIVSAARCAMAAGAITAESAETIAPEMSWAAVLARADKTPIF